MEKQNARVKSLVFKRNLDIFWKYCHSWMKGSEQTLSVCTVHHTFPESKQQQLDILQELVCCFSDTEAFFSFCMLLENIMGEQSRQLSVKYEKKPHNLPLTVFPQWHAGLQLHSHASSASRP